MPSSRLVENVLNFNNLRSLILTLNKVYITANDINIKLPKFN